MTDLTSQYLSAVPVDPDEAEYQRALSEARAADQGQKVHDVFGPVGAPALVKYMDAMQSLNNAPSNVIAGLMDAAINIYDTAGDIVDKVVSPEIQSTVQEQIQPGSSQPQRKLSDLITGKVPEPTTGPSPVRDVMVSLRDAAKRSVIGDDAADEFIQQTVQFMVPFSMATKAMGGMKAGAKAANVAKGAAAEAVTMFGAFDPHAGRFADLVRAVSPDGLAANRFIDYLTSRDNEGEMEGRFKNVVDSLAGSAAVGGALKVGGVTLRGAAKAYTAIKPTPVTP